MNRSEEKEKNRLKKEIKIQKQTGKFYKKSLFYALNFDKNNKETNFENSVYFDS